MSEPIAWAVEDNRGVWFTRVRREDAEESYGRAVAFSRETGRIVPLYPQTTLTDAEREAIDTAEASLMRESTDPSTPLTVRRRLGAAASTLQRLLERDAPAAHATPSVGSEQNGCALTDAERSAVEWFAGIKSQRPSGARTTLRGLLERMGGER